MIAPERAQARAESWISDWNSHQLEKIMRHYAPSVVFQTPTIIATLGVPDGRLNGVERLREHFARGLDRIPDLLFELDAVYTGVDSLLLAYRWRDGTPVAELHEYDADGLIVSAQALYVGLDW